MIILKILIKESIPEIKALLELDEKSDQGIAKKDIIRKIIMKIEPPNFPQDDIEDLLKFFSAQKDKIGRAHV